MTTDNTQAKPLGWIIEFLAKGIECTHFSRHNSIGDYRDLDPEAKSTALYATPQPVIALAVSVKPGLIVKISYALDWWETFIYEVNGRITTQRLAEIQAQALENEADIFTKGYGDYTFNMTYFTGQYSFEGRCELAPGWEFEDVEFVATTQPEPTVQAIAGAV